MPTERTEKGQAISPAGRTATAKKRLRRFIDAAKQRGDLDAWRRGRAMLGYIDGRRVIELAAALDVTRGAIDRWLQWYEAEAVEGLVTGKPPGAAPRLTDLSETGSAGSSRSAHMQPAIPAACGLRGRGIAASAWPRATRYQTREL